MHWSKLFIPTLREDPAEGETVARTLLIRAGFLRPFSAGVCGYLFLAQRSLLKIAAIVREEMSAIGAQEFHLPAIHAAKAMAAAASGRLRSYKQLPQIWYQIRTDPPGAMDACSFDLDPTGLDVSFEKHREACRRIFDRCDVKYSTTAAGLSQEFFVPSQAGQDLIVRGGNYSATLANATSIPQPPAAPDPEGDLEPEEFSTPNVKTIAEVARFTGLPETSQIKSLVMVADSEPVLALVRGDHQLSEAKLAGVLDAEVRPAQPDDLRKWFGADAGSLGPVGVKNVRILADEALRGRRNMIAGANRNDYHLRHVTPGEDFQAEFHDLRQAAEGDTSVIDGAPLTLQTAIEIGRLSKVGRRYSKQADLHVTNEAGEEVAPIMGSYGIGIERILSAAVELYHDNDGIVLPRAIAPFTVVVTPVNIKDDAQRNAAFEIYESLKQAGLDALLDDRDERPGVKFKDADLIGIPCRVTVGKKLPQGIVELVERSPKRSADVPIGKVAEAVRSLWTG